MSEPAIKSEAHRAGIRPDKDTFLAEENPFEAMMQRFDRAAESSTSIPAFTRFSAILKNRSSCPCP